MRNEDGKTNHKKNLSCWIHGHQTHVTGHVIGTVNYSSYSAILRTKRNESSIHEPSSSILRGGLDQCIWSSSLSTFWCSSSSGETAQQYLHLWRVAVLKYGWSTNPLRVWLQNTLATRRCHPGALTATQPRRPAPTSKEVTKVYSRSCKPSHSGETDTSLLDSYHPGVGELGETQPLCHVDTGRSTPFLVLCRILPGDAREDQKRPGGWAPTAAQCSLDVAQLGLSLTCDERSRCSVLIADRSRNTATNGGGGGDVDTRRKTEAPLILPLPGSALAT